MQISGVTQHAQNFSNQFQKTKPLSDEGEANRPSPNSIRPEHPGSHSLPLNPQPISQGIVVPVPPELFPTLPEEVDRHGGNIPLDVTIGLDDAPTQKPEDIEDYWTLERMQDAKPAQLGSNDGVGLPLPPELFPTLPTQLDEHRISTQT